VKIELLHIVGCPNSEDARRLLEETLREFGISAPISQIEITGSEQAQQLCFPGSPTIRINERDVEEPTAMQPSVGPSCRTYLVGGRRQGVPSEEMVREAIRAATPPDQKEGSQS